ncbi:hypothetical protein XI05_10065 [Bradyrhizobium sp. CCBAU 11357]|nr:hypothetical protein [Bradyrhizobium sp. CCBAU 11357]
MFNIYLNQRHDLLVVPRGFGIPAGLDGNWKIKKRAVRSVSDVIRQDVQQRGYHRRRLISYRSKAAPETSHTPSQRSYLMLNRSSETSGRMWPMQSKALLTAATAGGCRSLGLRRKLSFEGGACLWSLRQIRRYRAFLGAMACARVFCCLY